MGAVCSRHWRRAFPSGIRQLASRSLSRISARYWPDELSSVIYIDGFGNAMISLRVSGVSASVKGTGIDDTRTFPNVSIGQAFWYENLNGLFDIAESRRNPANSLGLAMGAVLIIT
jgi:S-adenosylmethionine hydrolase